jgi:hypothetical protein
MGGGSRCTYTTGVSLARKASANRQVALNLHTGHAGIVAPGSVRGLVAAHLPGTLPSDGALGTCVWKTHQGNRWDRRETKTGSTGHDTAPGKLTESDVQRLLGGWDAEPNVSMWARLLRCTRPNIRYHLERQGIPPRTS